MLQTGGRSTGPLRGRLAAGAVVAIVGMGAALAGCTNPEPAPIDEPTSEPTNPTKTPTPTPTPTPSETPTASPGSVEAELQAATVAFYTAVTKAYKTLDPGPIKALIVPNSRAGELLPRSTSREVKAKEHRFYGSPELRRQRLQARATGCATQFETVTFTLWCRQCSTEVDAAARKVVETFPAGSANGGIEFMKKGDRWLVLSQRFEE